MYTQFCERRGIEILYVDSLSYSLKIYVTLEKPALWIDKRICERQKRIF